MNLLSRRTLIVIAPIMCLVFNSYSQSIDQIKVLNKTDYHLTEVIRDFSAILDIDTIFLKLTYQHQDQKAPEAYLKVINRFQFEIALKKGLSKSLLARIVFHEMVHIHQLKSGRLAISNNQFYWQGSKFLGEKINYDGRPWEKEANFLTSSLFSKNFYPLYIPTSETSDSGKPVEDPDHTRKLEPIVQINLD